MNSKIRNRIILFAAVILCACSPALYIPSMADASHTGISMEILQTGRTLYTNHCGSCHNLHLPEQYTQKHWVEKMPEMQRKSKISDEETRLVTNFLLARCKPE